MDENKTNSRKHSLVQQITSIKKERGEDYTREFKGVVVKKKKEVVATPMVNESTRQQSKTEEHTLHKKIEETRQKHKVIKKFRQYVPRETQQLVLEALAKSLADGRLTQEEYDKRVTMTYRALSYQDLQRALQGLPYIIKE